MLHMPVDVIATFNVQGKLSRITFGLKMKIMSCILIKLKILFLAVRKNMRGFPLFFSAVIYCAEALCRLYTLSTM